MSEQHNWRNDDEDDREDVPPFDHEHDAMASHGEEQPFPTPWNRALDWLSARSSWLMILGIAFQFMVLGGIIAGRTIPYQTSESVYLRVIPIDPRDLFRGEDVTLAYKISLVPPEGVIGLPGPYTIDNASTWQNQVVYVPLVAEADGLHYTGLAPTIYQPASGERFIQGSLETPNTITFGIESFYLQEGEGKKYEEAIRDQQLAAEILLSPNGQARVWELHIEPKQAAE